MESEKSSTKAYILGAIIITVSLVIIGVSMSYAYFVNRVEEVNPENQEVNITSGDLTMNFTTSHSINATAAGLVNDGEIETKAEYTQFSIIFPSNSKSQNSEYQIYLTENKMTSNFKSTDLKWALYQAGANDTWTSVATGDFSGVTGIPDGATVGELYAVSNIDVLGATPITRGTTVSYRLYVWLSNKDDVNQNELLQGKLSTKVAFRAVAK